MQSLITPRAQRRAVPAGDASSATNPTIFGRAAASSSAIHRTFKDVYADHGASATINELQALCDRLRWRYNDQRPHQNLNQQLTAEVYQALFKVAATDPRPRRTKTVNHC